MRKKLVPVVVAASAQYFSILLGALWGFDPRYHWPRGWWDPVLWGLYWLEPPARWSGWICAVALVVESFRVFASQPRDVHARASIWVCLFLALLAGWTLHEDPVAWWGGDFEFLRGVCFIFPWLVAINFLVRGQAWLGVVACILFASVLLAMLVYNGTHLTSGYGFYESWIA